MSVNLHLIAVVLITVANAQPANNNCSNATSILDGVYVSSTANASLETNLTVDFSPCQAYYDDVWFSYHATCSGVASANVSGACDLVVALWVGTCSGGVSSHVCEDMGGVNAGETLFFRAVQNSSYLISVADYSSSCSGPFSLNMTCTPSPDNNLCSTALSIHDGYQQGYSNVGATVAGETLTNNPCGSSYFHDVWFFYNATCSGKTTIVINHTEADLEIVSWQGEICSSLTGLVCGDTGEAKQPDQVTFASVEGEINYVSVAGYSLSDFANFDISVNCVPTPPAPVNDECVGASVLSDGLSSSSLFGATHSSSSGNCSSDADVWFSYTASCSGLATITVTPTCATDDMTLEVWSSSVNSCTNVSAATGTCIDQGSSNEMKQFFVGYNISYLFVVGSKSSDPVSDDSFTISISCAPSAPPPANDNCTGAYRVVDGSNNAANLGATISTRNTGCQSIYSDVWFQYTANCTGITTATLDNVYDEVLVAWTGSNCSSLTSYQCAHNGPVHFPTVQGSLYYVSAGSYDVYQGPLLLTLSCSKVVPTTAPTLTPTAAPTSTGCPDFKDFLTNCSASNFTNNAQCTSQCAKVAPHIFNGTNLTASKKTECFSVFNSTWNPAAASILTQRLVAGSSLCRSDGFRVVSTWIAVLLGLLTF